MKRALKTNKIHNHIQGSSRGRDTRLYTLPCRSVGLSQMFLKSRGVSALLLLPNRPRLDFLVTG